MISERSMGRRGRSTLPSSGTFDLYRDWLAHGLVDWIDDAWAYAAALRAGATNSGARSLALGLIAEALVRGHVQPGAVTDGAHVPWECAPLEAIARIVLAWPAVEEPPPTPGEIVWFELTAAGEAFLT